MFRTVVSFMCAIAVFAPTVTLAGERHDRGFYNRDSYSRGYYNRGYNTYPRTIERVRTIDFYNRSRDIDRRDIRRWERRDEARERYWRDRRDDRYRREYRRDRYDRPRIIIIPRISF
ncbi:MAG: hypothetical protein KME42_28840 [Tildeniella nuda ZEHNDER 1965/U140]|nr:hypothetical protein [Tildeniella nuda ZEHNDER 1965/U140]